MEDDPFPSTIPCRPSASPPDLSVSPTFSTPLVVVGETTASLSTVAVPL
jgi:hypothetical protein